MFEHCVQLVATLFWMVMEPLRGGAWLEEVSHWTQSCHYLAYLDGLFFSQTTSQNKPLL